MTASPLAIGRAADTARAALRAALGPRLRVTGPDRTEQLALDGTDLQQHQQVSLLGDALRVLPVAVPQAPVFEGFLDGIQRSVPLAYLDGVPLVHGTAAAAIRVRDIDRRLHTWETPLVHHAVYASRAMLGDALWDEVADVLDAREQFLHDTDDALPVPSRHPSSLVRQALDALAKRRDALEREIGEQWCEVHADRALYVDGSLRTSHLMRHSAGAVGVVKSHATIYVADDQLPVLTALDAATRTSVLQVHDAMDRPLFHTWYLRLRSAAGHDPFFGLIRVEIGALDAAPAAIEAQADAVSTWLLAERAPLARPDARWDVMPYPVRDCELFLRAVA